MKSFGLTHFETTQNDKARSRDGPSSKSGWIFLICDGFSIPKLSDLRVFICIMFVFVEVHASEQV